MNTARPKILFVGDKWCSADPKFGLAEWENNLFTSLKEVGLAEVEFFHFDEYYEQNKIKGDESFIKKIQEYEPNIICMIIYKMPSSDWSVPDWKTIAHIKNILKIPIIAIWGDLENAKQVQISKALNPYATLHLATAALSAVKKMGYPDKYVYMWVPKDPKIFNNPNKNRDIDLSYVGTPKAGRLKMVNYLIENGIPVEHGGGERQEHLTTEQYADKFQRSKITLSFSRASDSHVINARPFEAMLCGAMVLEEESIEAPRLYTPFVDYIPYFGKKDLVEKAKYYLKHNDERELIARNGFIKTSTYYSAERFWKFAINRILNKDNSSPYIAETALTIEHPDLSRLPKWRAFKLKFLWTLCSNNFGFKIYMGVNKALNWRFYRSLLYKSVVYFVPSIKKLKTKKARL